MMKGKNVNVYLPVLSTMCGVIKPAMTKNNTQCLFEDWSISQSVHLLCLPVDNNVGCLNNTIST